MKIVWTNTAIRTRDEHLTHLFENFTHQKIEDFLNEIDLKIKLLKSNPEMGKHIVELNCRQLIIVKVVSLHYFIDYPKNTIVLLRFWGNRQDISSLL